MSSVFALWGKILRSRADVYVQLLLTIVAAAVVVVLFAIDAAARAGQGAGMLALLAIVVVVAVVSFGYGAALGALGEAARGDTSSGFWQRGYRLWGRTLGLFAVNLLVGIVLTFIIVLILGATGSLAGLSQIASLGSLQAAGILVRLMGVFAIILVVLVFLVGPYMQAAQAIIYVDQVPVLIGFSQAFGEAYGRGRLGHWLLLLVITIALDLVAGLIEAALGTPGQFLGILLSPAVLWLATALAFATYRSHQAPAASPEIIV